MYFLDVPLTTHPRDHKSLVSCEDVHARQFFSQKEKFFQDTNCLSIIKLNLNYFAIISLPIELLAKVQETKIKQLCLSKNKNRKN